MRVRLKGFLAVREAMGSAHDLTLDVPPGSTLRQLLAIAREGQSERFAVVMFDPRTGEPLPQNQVLLNGRHFRYLPAGLDSPLVEDDLVALFPPAAGG